MSTRFAKFEFQRGEADSAEDGKVLGRAEVALYDGPFVTDDVIDEIFCRRWNLPPPKLIISVTGSAQDWKKAEAAAAAPADAASTPPPPKPDAGSPAVHGKEAKDSKEAKEAKAAKDAKEAEAAAEVAEGVREQAAIMRFIKNCVYLPSLPHASRYFPS